MENIRVPKIGILETFIIPLNKTFFNPETFAPSDLYQQETKSYKMTVPVFERLKI